jgi:hypothetical protein
MPAYLLLVLIILLILIQLPLLAQLFANPRDDFFGYWTAIRFNSSGGNPYDQDQLFRFQEASGASVEKPLRYPPWALPLWMPFGLLDFIAARIAWLFLSLLIVIACPLILQRNKGLVQKDNPGEILALTGIFAPVIFSLMEGQVTIFVLLGFTGFLYFEKLEKWIIMGFCAVLTTIKPQISYLFLLALLFWSYQEKKPAILLTTLIGVGSGMVISIFSNQAIAGQFMQMIGQHPPDGWNTATTGAALRCLIGYRHKWAQILPAILGIIWLFFYWKSYRKQWDWAKRLPAILLATVITTPFAWMHDQVILLIPLIAAYACLNSGERFHKKWFWLPYVMLNLIGLLMTGPWRFQQTVYLWLPLAVLLFYYNASNLGKPISGIFHKDS